ncbi:MAG: LPS assembly lipoprotein LptE [Gallionellaceae bacterium]|jgi:LPS-assembly lipoprotein
MKNSFYAFLFATTLLLPACGFHLRGHGGQAVTLAFQSVYLKAGAETPFVTGLRNAFASNKVALSASPEQATITLEVLAESSDKQILSLSGAGKVLEYQLRYRVSLRAYDSQLVSWLSNEEIVLTRTLTYDDSQVLAKEQEEALLFKDMRSDAVAQAMRRLSRAKPPKTPVEHGESRP